jgi:multidrug resistance efflux pump
MRSSVQSKTSVEAEPQPERANSAVQDAPAAVRNAQELQARLLEQVQTWDRGHPALAPEPELVVVSPPSVSVAHKFALRRVIKSLLALAAVIALGWTPLQRFLQTTSAEAAVNARLVTLRAPIDGRLSEDQSVEAGTKLRPGQPVLRIVNSRADRSRLDDVRRLIAGLEAEAAAFEKRREQLEDLSGELRKQRDAFQQGRIEQLEARTAELTAEIAAADARTVDASSTLTRTQKLRATGYQSEAALISADRDYKVAANTVESLRQRLKGTEVELDAARKGLYVGDSYNDIPRTAQRLDEVTQLIVDLGGQIEERTVRLAELRSELTDEEKQYTELSSATVAVPVGGTVWEVLTANGEEVTRGQPLLRVIDCGGAVVTAAVSESTYNSLWLGQPATFHLRDESVEREGIVIGLNGLAAVPANLAIEQGALAREPYHVTVRVPSLSTEPDCYVGRTGKVTFHTEPAPAGAGHS